MLHNVSSNKSALTGMQQFKVIIIGAGQAGLSAAYNLKRRGLIPFVDFIVLDANPGPGGAWRHRWPSLTLGKAHGIHDLPGLKLGKPSPLEPASAVVARYYGTYEEEFEIPIVRPVKTTAVRSLTSDPNAPLIVEGVISRGIEEDRGKGNTGRGLATGTEECVSYQTQTIINATGTWDQPFVPYYPGIADFAGRQLHTKNYCSPDEFIGQTVAVVGGGASAVQFLLTLAHAGINTVWSTRRAPVFRDFDGDWGLSVEESVRERTLAGLPTLSVVGATGLNLTPEYQAGIDAGILISKGPIQNITKTGINFSGVSHSQKGDVMPAWVGGEIPVDSILWATGFKPVLRHLAPLRLRSSRGGIATDGAKVFADHRVFLAGYGAGASTIGATRTGRLAAVAAADRAQGARV